MFKSLFSVAVVLPMSAAMALAAPLPAAAQSQRVLYSDLDLTDPSDVQRLSFRVSGAVARACGSPTGRPLEEVMEQRACVAKVRAVVTPQVEDAILAARARMAKAIAAETLAQASPASFAKP